MATIKIVEKTQGQGLMRLNDEPWQNLLELDNGSFTEASNEFVFVSTSGLKVTADKNSIFGEDEKRIMYMGSMNEMGGPQILIDKFKSEKGLYVLRSFYPGSFLVVLNTDSSYVAPPNPSI